MQTLDTKQNPLPKGFQIYFQKFLVTSGGQKTKQKSIHNYTDRTAELRVEHVHIYNVT